jgi:hypothetical protein
MKKTITAEIFVKHWLNFSKDEITQNQEWLNLWQTTKKWSNWIVGTKKSSTTESPVGKYFSEQFTGLRYRTEDGLFDLSMSLDKNLSDVPTLDKNYNPEIFKIADNAYYPAIYDVLLEHENEIYTSWEEVAKLAWSRSFLKVLVTYNHDHTIREQIIKEHEMMIETMKSIISQCNAGFADHPETEYLLLIGHKEGNELRWFHQIFDANGKPANFQA